MEIRIEHLTKRYGPQLAVDDLSLRVVPGEVLGFLGPNGAGKTTTMRMVCGLTPPDAGTVLLGDQEMTPHAHSLRRAIGYLPEANPLYDDMPVLDLLRFGARLQRVPASKQDARIAMMVDACGLASEKHKRAGELSRGYRQRVGLALAMVHDPAMLILDEPTTGLDPNQVVDIRELIRELGRSKTVIFSTHILSEAEAVSDRLVIINRGRIVAEGTAQDLREGQFGQVVYRVRIAGVPAGVVLPVLQAIPGVAAVKAAADGAYSITLNGPRGEAIAAACSARGWALSELRIVENRLEDIFRKATTSAADA